MKPKLREIITTRRKGTVSRRAVRAAILEVIAEREEREGHKPGESKVSRRSSTASRK